MISDAMPGLRLLRSYRLEWLRGDLVAGLVLAAYLLPAGLGDASLAGLPPEAGLYACLFAGLVFWLFCSSRHTAVTVTSAISLLVGTSLGDLAGGDAARYAALASATALLVAALGLRGLAAARGEPRELHLRDGHDRLQDRGGPAPRQHAAAQAPRVQGQPRRLLGADGARPLATSARRTPRPSPSAPPPSACSSSASGCCPNRPVSLLVLVAGIAAVPLLGLAGRGVALLGEVPQGLPVPGLPAIRPSDVNLLLPLAMACFLLGAVETAAIGRTFARKHGYRLDSNQELLALAGSNLAAGLGHGFPVSGGMSQSLVNEGGGARTPLSGLVAAGHRGRGRPLPRRPPARPAAARARGHRADGGERPLQAVRPPATVAVQAAASSAWPIAALLGVLGSGLLRGVLIGVVISLLLLLRRASRPRTTELGRVPGTDYFADVIRHPENERVPDAFVFRAEASLLYFNVEHVRDRFSSSWERAGRKRGAGRLLPGGSCPGIDLAGGAEPPRSSTTRRASGTAFRSPRRAATCGQTLRRAGFEEHCGPVVPVQPVATVVDEWRRHA